MSATYLITGATGKQGGAAVRHLLSQGSRVHALVRDPQSPAATALARAGVVLFKGNFETFEVIKQAAAGCVGVFINLPPVPNAGELCRKITEVCKDAGVQIVVASTAMLTGTREKWDGEEAASDGLKSYFESNEAIEQAVRDSGLPHYTILRPAWLFSNYLLPVSRYVFPGLADQAVLVHSLEPNARLPHVDEADVGRYATAALTKPSAFHNAEIELASSSLTADEIRRILSEVCGKQIADKKRTSEEVELARGGPQMFQLWANRADITLCGDEIVSKYDIPLNTFHDYLNEHKTEIMALGNNV